MRPREAIAPPQSPDSSARGGSWPDDAGRLPNATQTAINASAISPAGKSPATNKPPIERLATKPSMIRLMQGGMVSAMTAEAASRATALPGFCLVRRAAGISTEPTAATSAILLPEMPENSTMAVTITTFSPPRMCPTPRHLLSKNHAGQCALHPNEDQCRQCQRKADRQSGEQGCEETDQHQRAGRGH